MTPRSACGWECSRCRTGVGAARARSEASVPVGQLYPKSHRAVVPPTLRTECIAPRGMKTSSPGAGRWTSPPISSSSFPSRITRSSSVSWTKSSHRWAQPRQRLWHSLTNRAATSCVRSSTLFGGSPAGLRCKVFVEQTKLHRI